MVVDDGVEIYQFKAKGSEWKSYLLYLGNISKDCAIDNMKNTELYVYMINFSVDYDSIDVGNVLNFHQYLTKKHEIK